MAVLPCLRFQLTKEERTTILGQIFYIFKQKSRFVSFVTSQIETRGNCFVVFDLKKQTCQPQGGSTSWRSLPQVWAGPGSLDGDDEEQKRRKEEAAFELHI